jgi:hypothetical protein
VTPSNWEQYPVGSLEFHKGACLYNGGYPELYRDLESCIRGGSHELTLEEFRRSYKKSNNPEQIRAYCELLNEHNPRFWSASGCSNMEAVAASKTTALILR